MPSIFFVKILVHFSWVGVWACLAISQQYWEPLAGKNIICILGWIFFFKYTCMHKQQKENEDYVFQAFDLK